MTEAKSPREIAQELRAIWWGSTLGPLDDGPSLAWLRVAEHFLAYAAELQAAIDRRKGDPVTRLHNLCEGLEDVDGAYSEEEWERIDKENAELRSYAAERERLLAEADAAVIWDIEGKDCRYTYAELNRFELEAIARHRRRSLPATEGKREDE